MNRNKAKKNRAKIKNILNFFLRKKKTKIDARNEYHPHTKHKEIERSIHPSSYSLITDYEFHLN